MCLASLGPDWMLDPALLLVFFPHCFALSLGKDLHGNLTVRADGVKDRGEEPAYKELCVSGVLNTVHCAIAYK